LLDPSTHLPLLHRSALFSLAALISRLPVIGLFTPSHMSYEIDRDSTREPSLAEMSVKAMSMLKDATKNSDKGFFMLIEGSRIDMAAHENDAATHVKEILAYQETIAAVKAFVEENPGTIMISVSICPLNGLGHPFHLYFLFASCLTRYLTTKRVASQ
jgi:alkaline phosphatase